ncbi:PRD domain-containing protein, partial [Anaerosalibacter bizertensis]|nr:PRD domain-containing protein [Anaerosalibacter bizertensis]
KYKLLFKKTEKIIKIIENKYKLQIPEDEIGYIAIHFGAAIERMGNDFKVYNVIVVCSSGIGTSQMLLSKLENFPQLNIIKSCSIIELEDTIKNNNVDLIISTIPIPKLNKKTVVVTPLLLEDDIRKIEKALSISNLNSIESKKEYIPSLQRKEQLKNIAIYGSNIIEILKNSDMVVHKYKNTENVIDELLDIHYKNKKITKNEKDKIL